MLKDFQEFWIQAIWLWQFQQDLLISLVKIMLYLPFNLTQILDVALAKDIHILITQLALLNVLQELSLATEFVQPLHKPQIFVLQFQIALSMELIVFVIQDILNKEMLAYNLHHLIFVHMLQTVIIMVNSVFVIKVLYNKEADVLLNQLLHQ